MSIFNHFLDLISKKDYAGALKIAQVRPGYFKVEPVRDHLTYELNWWSRNWDIAVAGAHKRGLYRDLVSLVEFLGFEGVPDTFPDGSLILEVAGRREAAASGECWGILIKAKGTRSKAVAQHILRRLQDLFDAGRFDRPGTEFELSLHDCCEHPLEPKCER